MMQTDEHLQPEALHAFVDRELTREDASAVAAHIKGCHACALRVLSATELKRATASAGQRLTASPATLARLTAHMQAPKPKARLFAMPPAAWLGVAAALVFAITFAAWQTQFARREGALSAELLDQHLATLSPAAAPQVLSTDRHTVKPWFQGKLPFSFNLPDAGDLPKDTVLKGADLAYLNGQPAALLLFSMRQHQVSVFLTQRHDAAGPPLPAVSDRFGFTVRSATVGHLSLIAVSDVNPEDLKLLVSSLVRVQTKD